MVPFWFIGTLIFSALVGASCKTIPDEVNFVVFDDELTFDMERLVNHTAKNMLDSSKVELGNITIIHFDHSGSWEPNFQRLESRFNSSDPLPDFIFDFTGGKEYSSLIKALFTLNSSVPIISTSPDYPDMLKAMESLRKNNVPSVKLPTGIIHFYTPSQMFGDCVKYIVELGGLSSVILVDGTHVKYGHLSVLPKFMAFGRDLPRSSWIWKDIGEMTSQILTQFISKHEVNSIFLYGTSKQITAILKEAIKLNKNLFKENYSWWASSTDVGDTFELPKGVEKLMLLTPTLHKDVANRIKPAKSKNIMDLFYMDVITETVHAVATMKHKDSKLKSISEKGLRDELTKNFQGKPLLGKYSTLFTEWEPVIESFKLEVLTKDTKNQTGILKSQRGRYQLDISDRKSYSSHLPVTYLNATIVIDPPFVIRDKACLSKKEKTDLSLKCYTGMLIDLLNRINREFNFKVFVTSEESYGRLLKDGTQYAWSGATDRLNYMKFQAQTNHIGIGAFSNDLARKRPVIFTSPFYSDEKTQESFAFAFHFGQYFMAHKFSLM